MPRISKKSPSNKKANILSENLFSVTGIGVSEGGHDNQEHSYVEAIFAIIHEPFSRRIIQYHRSIFFNDITVSLPV